MLKLSIIPNANKTCGGDEPHRVEYIEISSSNSKKIKFCSTFKEALSFSSELLKEHQLKISDPSNQNE